MIEEELSGFLIGCCIRVHTALGPGFLEKIYEGALAIEAAESGIFVERQKPVLVNYRGRLIGDHRIDMIAESRVVLELKACKAIEDVHLATARSYLKATGLPLALVINFAKPTLEVRRVVLTQ